MSCLISKEQALVVNLIPSISQEVALNKIKNIKCIIDKELL